jgi:hypothetical protein
MLFWFAGGAVAIVWFVFHDPGFQVRWLVAGALLPDVIDAPFGGARVAHSVVSAVGLLVVVMLATIGHRPRRRRLLALVIGVFLHLVLDGAFASPRLFWWPVSGVSLPTERLPSIARGWWNIPLELLGLVALARWWPRPTVSPRRPRARNGRTASAR